MRHLIFVVFIICFLGGCAARYEDVSSTPEYIGRVGEKCITTGSLIAHGVSKQLGKNKKTDYLALTTEPGFSGPEVTFRKTLPANTVLTIIGVRRCTNCFPPYVEFIVTTPALMEFHQYEVAAREDIFQPEAKTCQKT